MEKSSTNYNECNDIICVDTDKLEYAIRSRPSSTAYTSYEGESIYEIFLTNMNILVRIPVQDGITVSCKKVRHGGRWRWVKVDKLLCHRWRESRVYCTTTQCAGPRPQTRRSLGQPASQIWKRKSQ